MKRITLFLALLIPGMTAICQNPQLLKDVFPGITGSGIQQIVKTDNYSFFNAEDDDPDTERGLYRTDGTPAGTVKLNLLSGVAPNGYISTKAEKLTPLGNKIIFAGDNFTNYGEIWVSDGTQAGTFGIERFQPTLPNQVPVMDMARLGTNVLYGVVDGSNHSLLKKTDGTVAGTSLVYDFSGVASAPELAIFQTINGILYFDLYDVNGSGVDQLWRSDGTTAGTYMLKDFGTTQYAASLYMPAGNVFYMMIVTPGTGNVLWKSDGTVSGTVALKTIGTTGNNNYPPSVAVGSVLYFAGLDGNGMELWKTDGTATGTVMVADINPGVASSNPANLTLLNNTIYFSATRAAEGTELWKYDFTTASLVKDINPGTANSLPNLLAVSNNSIVFRATTAAAGSELWITDGSAANTVRVADINPGSASSSPTQITPGNPVYFSANNGVNGAEIFKYNNNGDALAGPHRFYVNDNSVTGDVLTLSIGNDANNGSKAFPFATINYAISVAQPNDTIYVDAGAYAERIIVNKPLSFKGANNGVNPGSSLNRSSESILLPSTENNILEIVTVQAPNTSFDGFLFDGDNPALTGTITLNGVDVNAGMAIYNGNLQTDNLVIKNNIIKNFYRYGMLLQRTVAPTTGNLITANHIDNISSRSGRDGRAVGFFNNTYGAVTDNLMTRVHSGLFLANYSVGSADSVFVSGNTIEAYNTGILGQGMNALTSGITLRNNQVSAADFSTWVAPGSSPVNNATGINLSSISTTGAVSFINNAVTGTKTGVQLSGISTAAGVKVNSGTVSNTGLGFFYINSGAGAAKLTLNDLSLVNNTVGLDASAADDNTMQLEFSGVTINGGTTGIRFYGKPISLPSNALSGVSFLNQSKEYILQTFHAFEGQTIDASTVSFDGITPLNMTQAQLFATEDKLTHRMDFDSIGYFKLKPTEVYLTPNSFAADLPTVFGVPTTTPDIRRAMACAAPGDIVYVAAGNYDLAGLTDTIYKPLLFRGANYGISPNDPTDKLQPNAARNAESVISNGKLSIAANGISIEGFTLDAGNRTALELVNTATTNNNYGNFNFSKNRLRVNTGAGQIVVTGKFVSSPNTPVTSAYAFTDNRFEKYDAANGTTFNLNYLRNINIADNAFVVSGATLKTQLAVNLGTTGIVDGFNFSNNLVNEASAAVGGNRIAGALISGNKMHNVPTAFSNTNSMPEATNIVFSNNELGNDLGTPFLLYNRTGTSIAGTSNILKVENNTITGVSQAAVNQLFASMNFTFSNTVLDPSFIIRGNKIGYSGDFSSVGSQFFRPITVRGNIANVLLENNELTVNNTGGLGAVVPTTFLPANPAISIITDNGSSSYMPANAIINVLNNKISGYKQSVVFYDVTNAGHDAYAGYGNIPAGATINVHNNSFTADSISINNGTAGQNVNATCNWYGTAADLAVAAKVTGTTVTFGPWLVNRTDNDVATGFQPVAGTCNGSSVTAVVTQATNISCHAAANGSVNVTISGGSTPYTFAWSKDNVAGFSNTEDLSDLAPGVYQLTVTDANGSFASTDSVTISEPDLLSAFATGSGVSCFGNSNGTASVVATGGTTPYTYLWSNGGTTNAISALAPGNYAVTVTDAHGCSAPTSYEVTTPAALTVVMTGTSATCTGSATATPAGGTSPYTYNWNNGGTTQTISGVPVGTYTVTVTDAHNCTVTGTRTISGNSPINPTAQVVNVNCFGGTGSITVTGAGGLAPRTYNINGGAFQASNVFPNLPAGVYLVGAKDATGCMDFVSKTITQPLVLSAVADSVKAACFGTNNGRIWITAAGGTGGKTYSWTGPNGFTSTSQGPNNLFAGTYNLTVTDAKGCTAALVVPVPEAPQISISESVTNVGCRGSFTGAIDVTVTGGSGSGFTYKWSGLTVTTEDLSGIKAGSYTITVTDIGGGCTASKVIVVTQPATNLSLASSRTNVTGCANLGTITAAGSGGTSPYQYALDAGGFQPGGLFNGLYAGNYTVWVKDANGCTASKALSITDNGTDQYEGNNSKNQAKQINIGDDIDARIALASDGADWFKFTTPAGSANYALNFFHPAAGFVFNMYSAGNNTPALVPLSTTATAKQYALAGNTTYYISITGGLSYTCYRLSVNRLAAGRSVNEPVYTEISKPVISVPEKLAATVYPNPHRGSFHINIVSPENGTATIELFTATGQKLSEKIVDVHLGAGNIIPFTGIRSGTIFYRVRIGSHTAGGNLVGLD